MLIVPPPRTHDFTLGKFGREEEAELLTPSNSGKANIERERK
jgi:hypothetical protein